MADNSTFLRHFFGDEVDAATQDRFGLSRRSRWRRLRQILRILHRHRFLRGFTPESFREALEDLGPSFVKIGQALSTRSEILPQAYCDELAKLQMEASPLPFDEVRAALEDIYHARTDEIFAWIDPQPLGSASLAQVHKARLVSGETVAVKVQRPGVKATMAKDIDIMRSLARRAKRLMSESQMLDLQGIVEEFWRTFLEETDFAREAENLELFARLNADVAFIACPRVYPAYCSEYVLVMEYVDGIPIYDTAALVAAGYDLEEIGQKILDNYATQILDWGFFHADPHPGNILVREGKVVYIDLGIMGRLSPAERSGFAKIIHAVGMKDAGALKDALIAFAVEKDNAAIDHTRMLADLDSVLDSYGAVDVGDLDIGNFLNDILVLTRSAKVVLPNSVTNVARGIVALEGTVDEFIPNDNIIQIINAHIQRSTGHRERARDAALSAAIAMRNAAEGMTQAAQHMGEALRMLTRGQVKVNMDLLGSDEPIKGVARIFNRLSMAMIAAGLFVAGSLFVSYEVGPDIMDVPVFSFCTFLCAILISVWVVVDIWRGR